MCENFSAKDSAEAKTPTFEFERKLDLLPVCKGLTATGSAK